MFEARVTSAGGVQRLAGRWADPVPAVLRGQLMRLAGAVDAVGSAVLGVLSGAATDAQPTADRMRPEPDTGVAVVGAQFDEDTLIVRLRGTVGTVSLVGPRAQVQAHSVAEADGTVVARLPLLASRWGSAPLALPSAAYRLLVADEAAHLTTDAPQPLRRPLFAARLTGDVDGVIVHIGPPLAAGERRPVPHRDHEQVYLRGRTTPQDAIYFESFYGRSASDNPAAVDRAVARLLPEVTRYWSVTDGSVAVPEGAVPVVEGSDEWWRVRAEARVYVINDWLRWTFHRRPYQHVLQTWHGTMLKRLALDRADVSLRRRSAVVRQQARWDALLSQNRYSSTIFRRAYAVQCPIWESGYPRNDVLHDPARIAVVRARLGLGDGTRVVLYAPTWRDDRHEMVDHLDPVALAADLPPDHVLLVRGHSRTVAHGGDVRGGRVLDVTTYPDMAELMLVADVLVTDYSSVMFDFVGTGRPIVFHTPDLDHYGERLRGFYFDLAAEAPGPLVTTRDELLDALTVHSVAPEYADRYASWQAQFTAADDGRAGERVVRRMLDEGWFG